MPPINPDDFDFSQAHMHLAAAAAAEALMRSGHVMLDVQPEDGTRYQLGLLSIDPANFWFSSNLGPGRQLGITQPFGFAWVQEHLTQDKNRHTAAVFGVFLQRLVLPLRQHEQKVHPSVGGAPW